MDHFFKIIAESWRRPLDKEEVLYLFKKQRRVRIQLIGEAPYPCSNLNYGFFYHKIIRKLPLRIVIRGITSTDAHKNIIRKGGANRVIVAGIIQNNRFDSFSGSWITMVRQGSPAYNFGSFINELILKHYRIK